MHFEVRFQQPHFWPLNTSVCGSLTRCHYCFAFVFQTSASKNYHFLILLETKMLELYGLYLFMFPARITFCCIQNWQWLSHVNLSCLSDVPVTEKGHNFSSKNFIKGLEHDSKVINCGYCSFIRPEFNSQKSYQVPTTDCYSSSTEFGDIF